MIGLSKISDTTEYFKNLVFDKEVMLNLLICMAWATLLWYYMHGIVNKVPIINNFTDPLINTVTVLIIVLSLPILLSCFKIADYLFYIAWFCIYGLNYVAFPDSWDVLEENAFRCLYLVFPYYFIGRILDINKLFTAFVWLACICIVLDAFYFMSYVQSTKGAAAAATILSSDNMEAAYKILPHVIMVFWATMRKFNIITLLLGFVGIVIILSCGTRGPLVCLGFFIAIYFFFMMKFKNSAYVKGGIIGIVGICFLFLIEAAIYFKTFFEELGLSTRIVDKFLEGGLAKDSGRSSLQDRLYNILDNSDNFLGFGFFGSARHGVIYAHSFVCDVFFTFGYYAGFILIIATCILIVYAFIKSRGSMSQQFLLLLISAVVIKLLLSSTFLYEPLFFMLIGYCVTIWSTNRSDLLKQ